jgi:DNA polymerase-1
MSRILYVIDSYAQIFRSYFAIRNGMRSAVTGEPTHAVFGVAGALFQLLEDQNAEYVALAWDASGPTFRHEMYDLYKAQRPDAPEDLKVQIPRVLELVEGLNIPVLAASGLEADDVMACIVRSVLADPALADVEIRLVSKDKDLEQLICDRVKLYDISSRELLDVEGLHAKRGITPAQVVDFLTLVGDAADNVPGVPGIGPKGAADMLAQYGSLDAILANLDQFKGKRRENLEAARATIPLSRELVTLRCEGLVGFDLEMCRVRAPRLDLLLPLFHQLDFHRYQTDAHRLAERLGAAVEVLDADLPDPFEPPVEEPLQPVVGSYRAITTPAELAELCATLASQTLVAVDTETTGLGRDAQLCGLSFAWQEGEGVYVPVRSPEPERHLNEAAVLAVLRPILENPAIEKCGHNLKFDAGVLLSAGVRLRGATFDSLLASMLLDPHAPSHKLDRLAEELLRVRLIPIEELIGEGKEQLSMAAVPLEQITPYAAEDADVALRLHHCLAPRLEELGLTALLRDVETPLAVVLAEMEANGVRCDGEVLQRQGAVLAERVEALRQEIWAAAGREFHLDSPKQLAEVLFDELGMRVGKRTKTGRSTDIEVLERLASEEDRTDPRTSVPRLVIEYRQLAKLISTYLGNLQSAIHPQSGRIHSTFHQLVTATGRLASHNPNLQNIPVRSEIGRQIRGAFVAPEGWRLICADYSQIELRLLAHLSDDPALMEAFAQDLDIHTAVAAQVFGTEPGAVTREQRGHAKTINFGIIYGVTPFGLARRIEGLNVEGAARLIADYKERFPGIDAFLRRCVHEGLEQGYVTTLLGRRRAIPELTSSSHNTRNLGERLAINSVVQGSAADLIKVAMVNVQRRIDQDRLPMRLLLQIHDELVLETPAELADQHATVVREEMERAITLRVPLRAEAGVGLDWMTAK